MSRLAQCRELLVNGPIEGLEWSRGELAAWLRRLGDTVDTAGIAEPYRLLLEGAYEAAADEFHRLSMPYDGALALVDSGDPALSARALDILDRLGADAVAAKVRRELRSQGMSGGTGAQTLRDAGQSGGTDGAPGRGAAPARRRADQRRTRGAAIPVRQDGGSPCIGDPGQAGGRQAARRCAQGKRAGAVGGFSAGRNVAVAVGDDGRTALGYPRRRSGVSRRRGARSSKVRRSRTTVFASPSGSSVRSWRQRRMLSMVDSS